VGYSKSIRAVKKVQPLLEQLVLADGKIEWSSENPHADAYALREGIKSAALRAIHNDKPNEPYYSFARLNSKFIFRTAPGKIIAEPRDFVPILALREAHSSMVAIVGAAITHNAYKMYFPDASIDCDLEAVYSWAKQNEYYLVVGAGLTLTRDNPGEIAWRPQDES